MPDIPNGESVEVQGSGSKPYILKNTGGVYSCTCPAWRNQSLGIEQRTCKHLKKVRGEAAELTRIQAAAERAGVDPQAAIARSSSGAASVDEEPEREGPPLLLAEKWDNLLDLTGWWMSEKLDGVRAYWNGQLFLSRLGNVYHAPEWYTQGLPETPLDGELWLDRKAFQRTISIVRRQDKSQHWQEIKFLVFDAPALDEPFEERVKFLTDHFQRNALPHAQAHPQEQCRNLEHLQKELTRIESLGGEGLMLRQPLSKYVVGRSSTLLKLKTFHDAEAKVVGHEGGRGKHSGRLGALLVELADGTKFSVGTGFTDRERENPPAVGSYVTFRYQELSDGGVPRFPSFVGSRTDAPPGEIHAPSKAKKRVSVAGPAPIAPAPVSEMNRAPADEDGANEDVKLLDKASEEPGIMPSESVRRFEYQDAKSNKFWEIWMSGNDIVVRYGRIGTEGQSSTKSFANLAAAEKYYAKIIDEKVEKGYEEKT